MNNLILDKSFAEAFSTLKKKQSSKTLEVLLSLVLYDKLYLPSGVTLPDESEFKDLISANLIESISEVYKRNETERALSVIDYFQKEFIRASQINLNKGIRVNTINGSIEFHKQLIDDDFEERSDSASNAGDVLLNNSSILKLNEDIVFEFYKRQNRKSSFKFTPADLSNYGFPFPEFFPLSELSDLKETLKFVEDNKRDFQNEIKSRYLISDFSTRKAYTEELKFELHLFNETIEKLKFLIEFIDFQELVTFSNENNIAIKADLGNLTQRPNNNQIITNPDNHYQVYKIILEEIEYMPRVSSIDDVINLRQDLRIKDFRENMHQWSIALNSGDIKQEEKLRKELRKSNNEIKNIKSYQKIGGIITYASLPLIAIDALTLIPAGTFLTVIGAAIQFKADSLKNKHKWLLFGRAL